MKRMSFVRALRKHRTSRKVCGSYNRGQHLTTPGKGPEIELVEMLLTPANRSSSHRNNETSTRA